MLTYQQVINKINLCKVVHFVNIVNNLFYVSKYNKKMFTNC